MRRHHKVLFKKLMQTFQRQQQRILFFETQILLAMIWQVKFALSKYSNCFFNSFRKVSVSFSNSQCAAGIHNPKLLVPKIGHNFIILTHIWGVWNTVQKNSLHCLLLHKPIFRSALYGVKLFCGKIYKKINVTLLY